MGFLIFVFPFFFFFFGRVGGGGVLRLIVFKKLCQGKRKVGGGQRGEGWWLTEG